MRRCVKIVPSLVAASLAVIIPAPPASAALCARWDPPAKVLVGRSASLSFRTYVPVSTTGGDYTLEPQAFPDYPFQVRASSPDGTTSRINMSPDSDDGQVWVGSLIPDRQGRWTLSITNLQGSDRVCYKDAVLTVEQRASSRAPTYAAIGLAAILAGLAGFALVRRRRLGLRSD